MSPHENAVVLMGMHVRQHNSAKLFTPSGGVSRGKIRRIPSPGRGRAGISVAEQAPGKSVSKLSKKDGGGSRGIISGRAVTMRH